MEAKAALSRAAGFFVASPHLRPYHWTAHRWAQSRGFGV